jgi:pimeloyl-ACP methyl ester carboxylesterase
MITGYAALSNMGLPYVVLGDEPPSVLIVPGVEPEHRLPDGLRLQGVRAAFEQIAERRSVVVAWRAERPAADTSLGSIAEDYIDLTRELELTDIAIVGVSTGAPMAIETAARLGPRCDRLALVAGGAFMSREGRDLFERSIGFARAGEWRRLAREQTTAFYPGFFGATVLAGVAWLFPALYGEPEDAEHYVSLTSVVASADLRSRCEDVSARALIVTGDRDLIYPPDIARQTALLLTDAESVVVPRAGHGVFKSHAGRTNEILLDHIIE